MPGGRHISLSSCAGLVGISPPPLISLRVGQSLTVTVTPGTGGFGPFSTDAPAVLALNGADTSTPTFIARAVGRAEMYVVTRYCTVHNGIFDSCPLALVTIAG